MTFVEKHKRFKPRLVFMYSPLIPRIKYLLAHPVFSHLFFYGDSHMFNDDADIVDDIHQSPLYHKFASKFPLHSEGEHGICDVRIAFGLSADRASLSKHKPKNSYAILPILLSICNWPIWVRCQSKYLLLSSLPPLKSHNPTLYFGKSVTGGTRF